MSALSFQVVKVSNGSEKATRKLNAKAMNSIYTQFNSYGKKGGEFVDCDAATSFGGGYWLVDGVSYVLRQA